MDDPISYSASRKLGTPANGFEVVTGFSLFDNHLAFSISVVMQGSFAVTMG